MQTDYVKTSKYIETIPHPLREIGSGTGLKRWRYKDGDMLLNTPVWYIDAEYKDLDWIPDGRKKGKDRPMLTRYAGIIDWQEGNLIRVRLLHDRSVKWANLRNGKESLQIQPREWQE